MMHPLPWSVSAESTSWLLFKFEKEGGECHAQAHLNLSSRKLPREGSANFEHFHGERRKLASCNLEEKPGSGGIEPVD